MRFGHAPAPNAGDHRTMAAGLEMFRPAPLDLGALFERSYPMIRGVGLVARGEVGVGLFAVDRLGGGVYGVRLTGRPGRVVGATIGRHSECDLRLPEDPWLANRQLSVLVHPLTSWEPDRLRYSVLDLRTQRPMVAEDGRALASVMIEGPFIAQLGRYVLYALPIGDATDFPERARDAWDQLPQRVYLDARAPGFDPGLEADARRVALAAQQERGKRSSVITMMGPLIEPASRLKRSDEPCVGELELRTDAIQTRYAVGPHALEQGILLGRYPRCDAAGILAADRVSRAHLLIKSVDGLLIALDTASTNGTQLLAPRMLAGPVRAVPLTQPTTLRLADVADVRWHPA